MLSLSTDMAFPAALGIIHAMATPTVSVTPISFSPAHFRISSSGKSLHAGTDLASSRALRLRMHFPATSRPVVAPVTSSTIMPSAATPSKSMTATRSPPKSGKVDSCWSRSSTILERKRRGKKVGERQIQIGFCVFGKQTKEMIVSIRIKEEEDFVTFQVVVGPQSPLSGLSRLTDTHTQGV